MTTERSSGGRPHAQHRDVVIIGAGQAGLAIGYHLARQGRDFTILEAAPQLGAAWRSRWDSLKLFTPRATTACPACDVPRTARQLPDPRRGRAST